MPEKIDVLIEASNRTSPVFREVSQDIRATGAAADAAGRQGESGLDRLARTGADVLQIWNQVKQAIQSVWEVAREGAISTQIEDVLGSYSESAGTDADTIVRAAEKAAFGTISQFDLMLQANRAFQFEVAKTPEAFAKLIELSTALGRAQGISDSTALDFLTSGIARESKLILDNLGLIIDISAEQEKYAASIGKTAQSLTNAENKTAILNEAYRQASAALKANQEASDSAATSFERFDAAIKNLRISAGELISASLADDINDWALAIAVFADMVENDGARSLSSLQDELAATRAERDKLAEAKGVNPFGNSLEAQVGRLQELTVRTKDLQERILELSEAQGGYTDVANQTADGILTNVSALTQYSGAARTAAQDSAFLGAAAQDGAAGLSTLEAMAWSTGQSLEYMTGAMNAASAVGNRLQGMRSAAISQAESLALRAIQAGADPDTTITQFGELAQEIQNTALSMETNNEAVLRNKVALSELGPEYTSAWEGAIELEQANNRAASAAGKIPDEVRKAQEAYNELLGKVEGVLGGALNVDVGVNPDDILPREDDVNENARRMADIAVNGFKSPWYDYFQQEFPALYQEFFAGAAGEDGVKLQAARILKNFQDGLEPELIDKEKAKERVRRMLIGEQNMAALAAEIAAELSAEFGSSLSVDQIKSVTDEALGTSISEATGSSSTGEGGTSSKVQLLLGDIRQQLSPEVLASAIDLSGVYEQISSQASGFGSGIRDGIVSALDGIGDLISSSLSKQLQAEGFLKSMEELGFTDGQVWVSGFSRSVNDLPGRVLQILASMLAPYMEAINAKNATLTGAN